MAAFMNASPLKSNDLDTCESTSLIIGGSNANKLEFASTGVDSEFKGAILTDEIDAFNNTTLIIGNDNATKIEFARSSVESEFLGPVNINSNLDVIGLLKVNTISNFTTGNGVDIEEVNINNGNINIAGNYLINNSVMMFMTEFESAENTVGEVTTSTTFQTHLTLNTASKPAGTYRIDWYYEWSHNAANTDFLGRVQLDGTDIMTHRQEPKDAGGSDATNYGIVAGSSGTNQRYAQSGWKIQVFATTATHTLTIQYRTDDASDESSIINGRLMLFRIS